MAAPPRRGWEDRLLVSVIAADVLTVVAASIIAWALRTESAEHTLVIATVGVPYPVLSLVVVPVWLACLAIGGAYDRSLLGSSTDEYSKVATVAAALLTIVCAASFLGSIALSRGLIAVFFPSLIVVGVLGRFVVRKALHRRRGAGRDLRRVVVVGDPRRGDPPQRAPAAGPASPATGWSGAYVPGGADAALDGDPTMPPVLGQPDQLVADLDSIDIDAIAVTGHGLFQSESLRSLAWRLHGTGIQLLMAPDLVDIAGPRIVSRPAGGLPMLLVEEPRTAGPAQLVKTVTERPDRHAGAGLPLAGLRDGRAAGQADQPRARCCSARNGWVATAGCSRCSSSARWSTAPTASATAWPTRTSTTVRSSRSRTTPGSPPSVATCGASRSTSCPQLWNVVRGDMALIGPRPPLPDEVALYGGDIARRLMVKPGITGLWQVSGRADMSWTEAVRLDLYYVENWSLTLDLAIIAKTAKAVLAGSGAY